MRAKLRGAVSGHSSNAGPTRPGPSRWITPLIRSLRLKPHVEGGFFRETYRAPGRICRATSILFLLPAGSVSRLHRIKSDEIWFFHLGGPLVIVELDESLGRLRRTRLGPQYCLQHTVKAGTWFGAYPEKATKFSLVGCVVAPGFDFKDFELAQRKTLCRAFPRYRRLIERLTA